MTSVTTIPSAVDSLPSTEATVLFVDDQPARLKTYETILAPIGEHLVGVGSGREALQYLLHHDVAVILLDVNMPEMDGFETAAMIRGRPRLAHTPIVFVSAVNPSELDRLRAYDFGAIDFVFVPIVPEILRAKVTVLVQLYRQQRALAEMNRSLEQATERLRLSEIALAEKAGGASERLNREIVETIGEGLWIVDGRWQTTFVNGAVSEMLGYSVSEIVGQTPLDFIRPADVAVAHRRFAAVSRFEREQFEFDLLRKDGATIRVLMSVNPLPPRDGRFAGALAALIDITARVSVEESLRRSERALRLAQEVAHIGHWQWNPETGETVWSDEAHRILEIPVHDETPSYELFFALIQPEDRDRLRTAVAELIDSRGATTGIDLDLVVTTRAGTRKTISERIVTDRDADGRVVCLRGTVQDITERKAIEETLRQRTENLERANAELERFNRAAVGRELRMIALKKEVNGLCVELGREPRYTIPEERGVGKGTP